MEEGDDFDIYKNKQEEMALRANQKSQIDI